MGHKFPGLPARSSKALAQMFERGGAITADKASIKSMQSERQKEIEMLLNRWNKNKQCASSGDRSVTVDTASNRPAVPDTHMEHVTYYCCLEYYVRKVKVQKVNVWGHRSIESIHVR
jgi:hypothetical protein